MAKAILYLYTESPLHAGTGSGLGAVDLPIQRERHTDYPFVQGSSIKGALRALAYARTRDKHDRKTLAVFGPPPPDKAPAEPSADPAPAIDQPSDYAGSLSVGDARLLLFPVRSLRGVFAYITAPLVLQRLRRDLELLHGTAPDWSMPALADGTSDETPIAYVTQGSGVTLEDADGALVLEEYTFKARTATEADHFAGWLKLQLSQLDAWWAGRIASHLVILPDTAFRDFVLYSTEVVTRIRIDYATKTVNEGALWTEENLPADSLLYSSILTRTPSEKNRAVADDLEVLAYVRDIGEAVFQLGGDETVGRGLVRPIWSNTGGAA